MSWVSGALIVLGIAAAAVKAWPWSMLAVLALAGLIAVRPQGGDG